MIDVYKYSDYRAFLRDYYHEKKRARPSFSYRYLALKAGLNSSSFFKYLMEGKRNLTSGTLQKIAKALDLDGSALEYFSNLVFFNQADSLKEKSLYFSKLTELRNHHEVKHVEPRDYEFYQGWYHPVVRELIVLPGLEDPTVLAKYLRPEITAKQAKESVELLLRLGFISQKEGGGYIQREPTLTTGSEIRHVAVINYQIKMLELSIKAFESAKPGNYLASSTTLGLSRKNFEKAKDLIRRCRAKLLDLAGRERMVEEIYQLNINLFPMTRGLKGSDVV